MNSGLFDVLHDAGDERVFAVAKAIDVDLDRVGKIAIEEQRILAEQRVDLTGLVVRVARLHVVRHQFGQRSEQIIAELRVFANDLHRAAAEHVGRAHDQRIPEFSGDQARLLDRIGDAVLGLLEVELIEQPLEAVTILREVDRIR